MDKSKIYLDLSKCTEEERKKVEKITGIIIYRDHFYIHFHSVKKKWYAFTYFKNQERKQEITYPEFIKLFEGGESKEVLQVENNEWIKSIAISHQKQMSSTHPHAIIGTIEDAIIEALETFKSNQ